MYVEQVIEKVKKTLDNNQTQSLAHKWDHIFRVYRRSIKIAEVLEPKNIDMELLKISALLHDIDQPYNDKKNHVKRSLRKAKEILTEINYPADRIQNILNIILEHSSEDNRTPSSIEAKILYDADKLDGLGTIGISRVFTLCGQNGLAPQQAIEWYKRKIEKAIPKMQTEIGKQQTKSKLEYVHSFFKKYEEEEKNVL